MKRLVLWFIIGVSWLGAALPPAIVKAVDASGLPLEDVSIYIEPLKRSATPVVEHLVSTPRQPASVIKLLTTYAALLELGFDYRWPTAFYIRGKRLNGILDGDLIIKGYGDPTLSSADLPSIVKRLKQKGIHTIRGNIVIDRSYFHVGRANSSHFDEYVHSPYNAMPDAMMFNERISTICVTPQKGTIAKESPDASYAVHNQLQFINKPCRGRYAWPRVKVQDGGEKPAVWLSGKLSKRCGVRKIGKVVTKPYLSFYYALKDALQQAGIRVDGSLLLKKVPSDATLLFMHYSESLEKIIAKTAKESNNLYARHLLLLLGAKRYGAPATVKKGRKAVLEILREAGALGYWTLMLDNGSGLSRKAQLRAIDLARVLKHAYYHYGHRWMKTLSIAGVDGTIKRRFKQSPVRQHAWMKTGTLKRVKNIAGYVKDRHGNYYLAVILVNTKKGRWRATKLQNDILTWLVTSSPSDQKGTTQRSAPAQEALTQGYYIQAGSFSHEPTPAYLHQLRSFSLPVAVVQEHGIYKVHIGPYHDEKRAREVLSYVRSHINNQAFLVKKEPLAE